MKSLKKLVLKTGRLLVFISLITSQSVFTQGNSGKLKVFVLPGQSNMEGYSTVEYYDFLPDSTGTIRWLLARQEYKPQFEHLVDKQGNLITREDVWLYYDRDRNGEETHIGPLNWHTGIIDSIGNSQLYIGPEAGIGWMLGDYYDEQVLLIKTCWGGHSLGEKFLPPTSGGPGPSYTRMLNDVNLVLNDIKSFYPGYQNQGYEMSGFLWNQGWNDQYNGFDSLYEKNLVNFIKDVRTEFKVPNMPFVIAESGNTYPLDGNRSNVSLAQEATADSSRHPEFAGNVAYVPTNKYKRTDLSPYGTSFGSHWHGSFYSYYKIGEDMGKAMVDLLGGTQTPVDKIPEKTIITVNKSQLFIDLPEFEKYTLSIYSVSGELLLMAEGNGDVELDLKSFNLKGIMFATLNIANRKILSKKLAVF